MRTLHQITSSIRHSRPKDVGDLLIKCDLPLLYLGSGSYRDVYEVVDSGYVVKMPTKADYIQHAVNEYIVWRKIVRSRRKYKELHPFMPNINYFTSLTGVTVMPKYQTTYSTKGTQRERERVCDLACRLFEATDTDLHSANYALDDSGQLKIIDLGYFLPEDE